MKKVILSLLIFAISSPIVAMEKEKAPDKSSVVIAAKKSGDEAKSADVSKAKADKESKKQSLLACFKCESKAENK